MLIVRSENHLGGLNMDMLPTLFRMSAERFFYEAMLAGYADSTKKSATGDIPGERTFKYDNSRDLRLVDTYFVTKRTGVSGGSTFIYSLQYGPLWLMQYIGTYAKEAIPCLKAALSKAYAAEQYIGGRGPLTFKHNDFLYHNAVQENHFFGSTSGNEIIFSPEGNVLGEHTYQAKWMAGL